MTYNNQKVSMPALLPCGVEEEELRERIRTQTVAGASAEVLRAFGVFAEALVREFGRLVLARRLGPLSRERTATELIACPAPSGRGTEPEALIPLE